MKFFKARWKASHIFAQCVIIFALLYLQFLLVGCVSADNGASVTVDKQTEITIPVNVPDKLSAQYSTKYSVSLPAESSVNVSKIEVSQMKKLFYVYDSVEEVNVGYFECQSLDILLRNNGKVFSQMSPHYADDWRFFCLGNAPRPHKEGLLFDFDTGNLQPIDIKSSSEVECKSTPMTPEEVEKLKSEK